MENDIKVEIVGLEDSERFTVYSGNDSNNAFQSEVFAKSLIDKSDTPAIVVRSHNPNMTDSFEGIATEYKQITQNVNEAILNALKCVSYEGRDIGITDIDHFDYIKDDVELPGRIVIKYINDSGTDVWIDGLQNGITQSLSNAYANVVLNDGIEYYIYFYYDKYSGLVTQEDAAAHAYLCTSVEFIWDKMKELGYNNSYISLLTNSNPYLIEERCGLEVDQKYLDELGIIIDSLSDNEDNEIR